MSRQHRLSLLAPGRPADELHEALIEQLRTTMSTVARHLDMHTPPALPNLTSAGHLLRQ